MRAEDIFKSISSYKKNDWQEVLDKLEEENRFFIDNDIGNDNDYYKFEKDITNIHNQLKTINTKLDNLISIIKSQID